MAEGEDEVDDLVAGVGWGHGPAVLSAGGARLHAVRSCWWCGLPEVRGRQPGFLSLIYYEGTSVKWEEFVCGK
ncbi:hypothetical protein FRAHR75_110070 [Frankia sp. Hr75.2]|nr:hypothetical protein FRAHR75_110070 [Frankia sp. Hr75.2]